MKKKVIVTIVFVILLIVLVVGATYAVYTWAVDDIGISGNTNECFRVNYVKGQDIGSENESRIFMPSDDYTGGLYASVIVDMDKECINNGVGTLYLNTDESTSEILLTSGVLKYQIIINSLTLGPSGTITSTGITAIGENLNIVDSAQFTVVVWIDGNMINSSNLNEILSSSYIGSISMKVESGDL